MSVYHVLADTDDGGLRENKQTFVTYYIIAAFGWHMINYCAVE